LTLLRALFPSADLWIDLSDPSQRSEYLARPGRLVEECRPLLRGRATRRVVIDEVQNVPALFDAIHLLVFLAEQGKRAPTGYVICRCSRPREIAPNVVALPWHQL
jgi:hypothetical protein